jgi:hypothetical protein
LYVGLPRNLAALHRCRRTSVHASTQEADTPEPTSWDDRNDSHYIQLYKEKKRLGSVLALCFTEAGETYHHWKVFSSGTSGVCVRFKKDLLLAHLAAKTPIRAGPVQYKMMDHLRTSRVELASLPFLKRYAFRDEREFRLLYDTKNTLQSRTSRSLLSASNGSPSIRG